MTILFPSIWLGSFDDFTGWKTSALDINLVQHVIDGIDDRLLFSRHPFVVQAWCSICAALQAFQVTWHYAGTSISGSVNPAWTETAICPSCHSNSRMRALYSLLTEHFAAPKAAAIYIAEQVTPFYRVLKARFPSLVGSEYLGPEAVSGKESRISNQRVKHEDITRLSFATESFDIIITQDVFEHVPDYAAAFSECARVVKRTGYLVFTVPFFPAQPSTEIRATIASQGNVQHISAPEYHGNPLGGGSLCFQHFGWDMLEGLRRAGFSKATAHLYWGPWRGHFGFPFFIFSARA